MILAQLVDEGYTKSDGINATGGGWWKPRRTAGHNTTLKRRAWLDAFCRCDNEDGMRMKSDYGCFSSGKIVMSYI